MLFFIRNAVRKDVAPHDAVIEMYPYFYVVRSHCIIRMEWLPMPEEGRRGVKSAVNEPKTAFLGE